MRTREIFFSEDHSLHTNKKVKKNIPISLILFRKKKKRYTSILNIILKRNFLFQIIYDEATWHVQYTHEYV